MVERGDFLAGRRIEANVERVGLSRYRTLKIPRCQDLSFIAFRNACILEFWLSVREEVEERSLVLCPFPVTSGYGNDIVAYSIEILMRIPSQ